MTDEAEIDIPPRNPLGCAAYHSRIDRIERTAEKTAVTVFEHGAILNRISERVAGLSDAHDATLVAVRASTEATSRLSEAIRRFDDKLDVLMTDYTEHKIDAERDRRSAPRVAVALWLTSLGLGGAALFFLLEHWPDLLHAVSALERSGAIK